MHDFTLIINLDTADVTSNRKHFHYNSTDPSIADFSPEGLGRGKIENIWIWGIVQPQSSVIGEQEGKGVLEGEGISLSQAEKGEMIKHF